MCGIAGIVNLDPGRESGDRLLGRVCAMARAMRRRGPDGEGYALFGAGPAVALAGERTPPGAVDSGLPMAARGRAPRDWGLAEGTPLCALAHRRLSVLDLSAAGHQPMCTEDRRFWIAYNGEVYNHLDLRAELEAAGERFFSDTDTETVLRAFVRWGPECVQRFVGMWAFAVWDDAGKNLFLCRDRLGIKPLFVWEDGARLAFASDVKTLLASGLIEPRPDWEGVYHGISLRCAPRPTTCFAGVRSLPQAGWMRVAPGGPRSSGVYWTLPEPGFRDGLSLETAAAEVREIFEDAVARRMVADVPVGVFMSGGVDSTGVASLAAARGEDVRAFTLDYEGAPELDETAQARQAAERWNMRHTVSRVRAESALDHISEMVRCFEEPFHILSPDYMVCAEAARGGVTVVLNGLGGDELFCGYGRERMAALWRALRLGAPLAGLLPRRGRAGALRELMSLRGLADLYVFSFSIATEAAKRRLMPQAASRGWDSYETFRALYGLEAEPWADDVDGLCRMDILNYIGNHHTYRTDQFTMHFSLEGRLPLLDHRLVELACAIPGPLRASGGVGKRVLREALRGTIPDACLGMPKKGFTMPMARWLRGPLQGMAEDCLRALCARGPVDGREAMGLWADFQGGGGDARLVWHLVHLELWLREFFDGPVPGAWTEAEGGVA